MKRIIKLEKFKNYRSNSGIYADYYEKVKNYTCGVKSSKSKEVKTYTCGVRSSKSKEEKIYTYSVRNGEERNHSYDMKKAKRNILSASDNGL